MDHVHISRCVHGASNTACLRPPFSVVVQWGQHWAERCVLGPILDAMPRRSGMGRLPMAGDTTPPPGHREGLWLDAFEILPWHQAGGKENGQNGSIQSGWVCARGCVQPPHLVRVKIVFPLSVALLRMQCGRTKAPRTQGTRRHRSSQPGAHPSGV